MAKTRTGHVFQEDQKRWFARLTYTDAEGQRHNLKRRAENKTAARETLKQLLRDLEDYGERSLENAQMTFADLVQYYEEGYLKPAEYRDGRKIAGLRSARYCELYLRTLKEHFGQRKPRSISYGDLEAFKLKRLETPTARNQERSLANVHRTLALLRHLFNLAVREGWLLRNPFVADKSLINVADETKRERVLSGAEEMRLLAACVGPRAHLKPILICALDTGMRQGEIFKLQWADVDLVTRRLTMQAMNSKTLRARQIALTERLTRELEALRQWLSEPKTLLFEEEFAQSLVEQGLVSSLPDTDASLLPATNRQPVPVLGQSVSQAILEERR